MNAAMLSSVLHDQLYKIMYIHLRMHASTLSLSRSLFFLVPSVLDAASTCGSRKTIMRFDPYHKGEQT